MGIKAPNKVMKPKYRLARFLARLLISKEMGNFDLSDWAK
jgi:hypothetical protein